MTAGSDAGTPTLLIVVAACTLVAVLGVTGWSSADVHDHPAPVPAARQQPDRPSHAEVTMLSVKTCAQDHACVEMERRFTPTDDM